jgi:ABC-type cobalamin/Fe3+-siderophores transport system ATPase subunit
LYEFTNLRQDYGERTVLYLPGLSLDTTGSYALVGENGAGKTTLLNHLARRLRQQLPLGQVGLLPQKPYAFSLKVSASVGLGLPESLRLSRAAAHERVLQQLAAFGLQDLADKRADRLSGGESQRLALARLLLIPRQVLLLDEPGNHLDPDSQENVIRLLREYRQTSPCLMIVATHQVDLAARLADEVLVLEQGLLTFRGSFANWEKGRIC